MIQIFLKGGPIMWPILFTSIIALSVVVERLLFIISERVKRQPRVVEQILASVENDNVEEAMSLGRGSKDFVARTLAYALAHRKNRSPRRSSAPRTGSSNGSIAVFPSWIPSSPSLPCWDCWER